MGLGVNRRVDGGQGSQGYHIVMDASATAYIAA